MERDATRYARDPSPLSAWTARKPRLLWASLPCLLDVTSGAIISVRQALLQLAGAGIDLRIVGAPYFTSHNGARVFAERYSDQVVSVAGRLILHDGPLRHDLVAADIGHFPEETPPGVQDRWRQMYEDLLRDFRPDMVWFLGKGPFNDFIPRDARALGIPSAAYGATETLSHVDTVVFDSQANADRYRTVGAWDRAVIGKFIDPQCVVAGTHRRERVTFINPAQVKGVAIVVALAWLMERRRPDIVFEVVQSRGDWHATVKAVTTNLGDPREGLNNVIVTDSTADMRPIYARSRLVLAPSLWFEAGARVLAEAMLNGIPVIATDRGGNGEMIGDGGILINLPDRFHEAPYSRFPDPVALEPLVRTIETLFDDGPAYRALVRKAYRVGRVRHDIADSTARLIAAFSPLLDRRAGDGAAVTSVRR